MRYIRTKDGRIIDLTSKQVSSYEIVDDKEAKEVYRVDSGFIMVYYYDDNIGEHIEYDGKGGRSMDNWYLKDIEKQADTIEELCDEFVVITDLGKHISFDEYKESKICYLARDSIELYGAIWTDKGPIYVAKMNDKGELELL